MLDLFRRALLFWLSVFELLAGWRGWWGLSSLGRTFPHKLLLPLPIAALYGARADGWRQAAVALAFAAPPALLLQIAASSFRNWALNPLLQLRPGRYADRTIERLDIPMCAGYLPALHIIPQCNSRFFSPHPEGSQGTIGTKELDRNFHLPYQFLQFPSSFSSPSAGEQLSSRSVKAAVCVIHGSGCDKTSYVWRLVDTLVSRGMAVLLIDIDGHGENPRVQSFPAITEDVDVAVAWLRDRYERVGLIGISLGGAVAARAVADGTIVDGLALLEAPPLLHYTQADIYREAAALARPQLLGIFSDCTVYHLVRAWETAPIRCTISTWDLFKELDLLNSLPRISVPLLLLYGSRDAIVKPAQAEQVRQAIPPGATFRLVPGASHLTLILTHEALLTIGEWFGKTLAQDRD